MNDLQETGMKIIKTVEADNTTENGNQKDSVFRHLPLLKHGFNNQSVKIGSETTNESYSRTKIEDFGKKIMQNLGWKEREKLPLGRNPTADKYVEPNFANLIPRQGHLGLGAKPLSKDEVRKLKQNGQNQHLKMPT